MARAVTAVGARALFPGRGIVIAAAILGAAVAGWSFVDAYANVTRVRDPERTLRLRPGDALARAYAADRAFLAAPADPAVQAASMRAARYSLDKALLNPVAVRLSALRFENHPRRLLAALDAAQALTRQDITTQLLLIEANVGRGDVAGALHSYDRILRRKPVMGDTLFPVLAGAARDPAIIPSLRGYLSAGAPWSGAFIDWAVANDRGLPSLLPVIYAASTHATGLNRGRQQAVIRRLTDLGQYAAAAAAYRRFAPAAARGEGFAVASVFAPFDWEVQNGPGIDGTIDPAARVYQFTLLGESRGLLLRRLVQVAPGRTRLDLAGELTGPATAAITARATCVATDMPLASATLGASGRVVRADMDVPAGCRFVWLTLEGAAASDEAAEGTVSRLRLDPVAMPG